MKYFTNIFILTLIFFAIACSDNVPMVADGDMSAAPIVVTNKQIDSTKIKEEKAFIARYEGAINNEFAIGMTLINWGDGSLSGNYFYNSVGKTIELNGRIKDSGFFRMQEYDDDKMTGLFKGTLVMQDKIQGEWQNRDSTRIYPFELNRVIDTLSDRGWAGSWYLNDIWDGGQLIIGNVGEETFDFALSVVRSNHIAVIDGTATIDGKKAFFQQKKGIDEACQLTFEQLKGTILLEQNSSTAACDFGMRAYVGAVYEPEQKEIIPQLNYGNEGEIFENKKLHDAFKKAVGDVNYEIFAFNMQMVEKQEKHPKDAFEAEAKSGIVAGNPSYYEAIILNNRRGDFWAATIDIEGEKEKEVVRYFTNVAEYRQKLPYTIDVWRKNFSHYPVIFMNK